MTVFDFVHEHPRYKGRIDGISEHELERLLEFKGTVIVVVTSLYIGREYYRRFTDITKSVYGNQAEVHHTKRMLTTPEATYIFIPATEDGYKIYGFERGPVVFINRY